MALKLLAASSSSDSLDTFSSPRVLHTEQDVVTSLEITPEIQRDIEASYQKLNQQNKLNSKTSNHHHHVQHQPSLIKRGQSNISSSDSESESDINSYYTPNESKSAKSSFYSANANEPRPLTGNSSTLLHTAFGMDDNNSVNDKSVSNESIAYEVKEILIPKTFGVVGVEVQYREEDESNEAGLYVAAMNKECNAYKQGVLQINDKIIELDGKNVEHYLMNDFIAHMKKHEGTSIFLKIKRKVEKNLLSKAVAASKAFGRLFKSLSVGVGASKQSQDTRKKHKASHTTKKTAPNVRFATTKPVSEVPLINPKLLNAQPKNNPKALFTQKSMADNSIIGLVVHSMNDIDWESSMSSDDLTPRKSPFKPMENRALSPPLGMSTPSGKGSIKTPVRNTVLLRPNQVTNSPARLPSLDTNTPVTKKYDFKEYDFILPKTDGVLRVDVKTSTHYDVTGLFVTSIGANSNVEKQGLLHVNDEIIYMNDKFVEGGTVKDMIATFADAKYKNSDEVKVRIRRYHDSSLSQQPQPQLFSPDKMDIISTLNNGKTLPTADDRPQQVVSKDVNKSETINKLPENRPSQIIHNSSKTVELEFVVEKTYFQDELVITEDILNEDSGEEENGGYSLLIRNKVICPQHLNDWFQINDEIVAVNEIYVEGNSVKDLMQVIDTTTSKDVNKKEIKVRVRRLKQNKAKQATENSSANKEIINTRPVDESDDVLPPALEVISPVRSSAAVTQEKKTPVFTPTQVSISPNPVIKESIETPIMKPPTRKRQETKISLGNTVLALDTVAEPTTFSNKSAVSKVEIESYENPIMKSPTRQRQPTRIQVGNLVMTKDVAEPMTYSSASVSKVETETLESPVKKAPMRQRQATKIHVGNIVMTRDVAETVTYLIKSTSKVEFDFVPEEDKFVENPVMKPPTRQRQATKIQVGNTVIAPRDIAEPAVVYTTKSSIKKTELELPPVQEIVPPTLDLPIFNQNPSRKQVTTVTKGKTIISRDQTDTVQYYFQSGIQDVVDDTPVLDSMERSNNRLYHTRLDSPSVVSTDNLENITLKHNTRVDAVEVNDMTMPIILTEMTHDIDNQPSVLSPDKLSVRNYRANSSMHSLNLMELSTIDDTNNLNASSFATNMPSWQAPESFVDVDKLEDPAAVTNSLFTIHDNNPDEDNKLSQPSEPPSHEPIQQPSSSLAKPSSSSKKKKIHPKKNKIIMTYDPATMTHTIIKCKTKPAAVPSRAPETEHWTVKKYKQIARDIDAEIVRGKLFDAHDEAFQISGAVDNSPTTNIRKGNPQAFTEPVKAHQKGDMVAFESPHSTSDKFHYYPATTSNKTNHHHNHHNQNQQVRSKSPTRPKSSKKSSVTKFIDALAMSRHYAIDELVDSAFYSPNKQGPYNGNNSFADSSLESHYNNGMYHTPVLDKSRNSPDLVSHTDVTKVIVPKTNGLLQAKFSTPRSEPIKSLILEEILPSSKLYNKNLLLHGDEILEINQQSVRGLYLDNIYDILLDDTEPIVELLVRRANSGQNHNSSVYV